MTLAPLPSGAAPVRLRGHVAVLLVAALACGFGVGAFGLTIALPVPAADMRMPELSAQAGAPVSTQPEMTPRAWPAAFGTPPPPPPPPAPVVEPEPPPEPFPPLEARLRGLAVDDDGGWALVEIDGQVALVRPGSPLDGHHGVAEIQADGVLVFGPDGMILLAFAESDPSDRAPTSSVRESLARSYLRGEQDLFDMPTPLPPAGYIGGPGFMGPLD
jgi:hypothetical protein